MFCDLAISGHPKISLLALPKKGSLVARKSKGLGLTKIPPPKYFLTLFTLLLNRGPVSEHASTGVARQNDSHARQTLESDWRLPETLEPVWREPRPRQSYSSQSGGRQADSKVVLAAARQTPECIWRPL
ncbi:hypothetical protein PoB_000577800 [Plakobranchus ocellatus]|uniref:Uncharacterized protein n=1 Tax=Plakobranchus ocellatus TaxID=259542 RepID=A0AAV3Y9X9_9GAST|nr:hypothetical protein PoB_000577800 [Plakobranchus ocellatus]